MKKTKLIVAFILLLVVGMYFISFGLKINTKEISESKKINETSKIQTLLDIENILNMKFILSDSDEELARGLSGVKKISDEQGMFFIFNKQDKWGIWMKEMNFAIDIVWLSNDFEVVGLKPSAEPSSFPQVFYPERPATYVIEANVGFIQNKKLHIGQKIISN